MRRLRVTLEKKQSPRPGRDDRNDVLPLDPRDPDVRRAKNLKG
jgi:hypothetical protein